MCRLIVVSGSVQGVGYRAFARRAALALGIRGHAINLPDGRVEVLACGETAALDAFVTQLRAGPTVVAGDRCVGERGGVHRADRLRQRLRHAGTAAAVFTATAAKFATTWTGAGCCRAV